MINEKNNFLTVSWLSGLLSAEIFISTGEWGVQMPPLTSENSYFLRSGPQGATLVMLCGLCGHSIYDNHMGCNMYIGREQIPVWPYEPHCVTTRYHGYYTIAFGRPMWPSSCGPLSWECGHTGHNKYRYFHETLMWPHGLQWALIFA